MFTVALYTSAIAALIISYYKDKGKTKQALKKAYKAFTNILPEFLTIIIIIGFALAVLKPESISKVIGDTSGITGLLISSGLGAVTLVPGFIAFPLAKALLENGAGIVPIAAFVSSLMMVGVVTLPLEIKYFGKKAAYVRNGLAFIFSIVIALLLGVMPWVL
ncbi:MAG: permease [Desulfitibacter sp. BRH_c19]|nr:MAG: permease [Desulfitibacter sp. BRH_c19]